MKLVIVSTHPIQYQAPLFREISDRDGVELLVIFENKHGVIQAYDSGFQKNVKWDIPLLKGYESTFICEQKKSINRPRRFKKFYKLLENYNPDGILIHGWGSPLMMSAYLFARKLGIPSLTRTDMWLLDQPDSPILQLVRKIGLRQLFNSIDLVSSVGIRNKNFYRHHGVPEKKIRFAPYSVDNQFFRERRSNLPTKRNLKESEGIGRNKPVVLYVGKTLEIKQPDWLLNAFCRAVEPNEATLIIVGSGPLDRELQKLSRTKYSQHDIRLPGFINQSELPTYYKMSDVFVLPSKRENWGLVINEAMNFSLPIITTEVVGAAPDLVDENNGYIVPPEDTSYLSEKIAHLVSNSSLREQFGETSYKRIDNWGIAQTASGIIDSVKKLD
ncbi:glycosyltransferase family 4 protein [Halomontanus rarus]|uniref:glycosyltransferase family 4 protein n=1 Tax=Halomontanus rarus TaxID=3034020 RepID=UPI0023E7613C|nr:glycosyltransferase family 4 protein [Halovivax sp. TS33]